MTTAFFLIVLGVLARVMHLPPNVVPMGAIALYAGAKLPRRWAFLVPMVAMAASDLWIDWGTGQPVFTLTRVSVYATFALIVAAGQFLRLPTSTGGRIGLGLGLTVGASTAFFLTTNLAVWLAPQVASPGHPTHPATFQGLMACYIGAIPFYRNALVADLCGVVMLFGLDWAVAKLSARGRIKATLAVE